MHILIVRSMETVLGNQIEGIGIVNCVTRKNHIAGQITCVHNCFQELVPIVHIKHIWQFLFKCIKALIAKFEIYNTFFIKVSTSQELVSILQASSIKGIRHHDSDNILRIDFSDLIVRGNPVLCWIC